jgi:hypothetical protein
MRLLTQREYEVTCEKLADLQRWYDEAKERETENEHVKELTLRSLARLIKQLKEEKIWYECHTQVREPSGQAIAAAANAGGTSETCTN